MRRPVLIGAVLLAAAPALEAQVLSDSAVAAWRSDLAYLRRALPHVHPDPFRWVSEARWDSARAALDARLPGLTAEQAWVGLQNLTAFLGDGHSGMNPLFDPGWPMRYYPYDLIDVEDGLFVTAAAPAYARAVGARVTAIGGMPVREAMALVAAGVPAENEWWIRAWAPQRLTWPEVVRGAGITDAVDPLVLTLEKDGRTFDVAVRPAGPFPRSEHGVGDAIDRRSWARIGPATLAAGEPDRPYWFRWVPESGMLYVNYRAVIDWPGERNAAFWARVFAAADSLPVRRLVLDLRENTGGNNVLNLPIVQGVLRRPDLDRPDRFYVLIGRRTFSAGMNLVNELERYSQASFVGEPTGSRPNMFGDHEPLPLPATGLRVMISRAWWQTMTPRETRRFVAPRLYAPPSAADMRRGTDPALEAVLADTLPPVRHRVAALAESGDVAALERFVRAEATRPVNRFAGPEAAVNAAGYALLNAGRVDRAIQVFAVNTRVFPRSANVWDSYGEALARAGRRAEAIAAFERALAIDPDYPTSREWLARLRGN